MNMYNYRINKDFLRDVLKGERSLLKMSEVNFCNVPAFDEIGVKALYSKVIKLPGMGKYFPSSLPKGKQCCKQYMYNVWNTVYPEDVQAVLEKANANRYAIDAEKVKEQTIVITQEWKEQLEAMPFVSKQKGRMSHLLKQKSKIGTKPKERVTYEAFDFSKRPRITSTDKGQSNTQSMSQSLTQSQTQP